jgi:hypothetical protein
MTTHFSQSLEASTPLPLVSIQPAREMGNISRGPTFGDFVTIRTEGSLQDVTVARLQSTGVQTPFSPSNKCTVLRESLSEDIQNIPCATLNRRGSWLISIYLCNLPFLSLSLLFFLLPVWQVEACLCSVNARQP